MEGKPHSEIALIFQRLNRDDKEHCKRIHRYMKKVGILLSPEAG
jgi:hypothetical protein